MRFALLALLAAGCATTAAKRERETEPVAAAPDEVSANVTADALPTPSCLERALAEYNGCAGSAAPRRSKLSRLGVALSSKDTRDAVERRDGRAEDKALAGCQATLDVRRDQCAAGE